jgi:hypothetical protein
LSSQCKTPGFSNLLANFGALNSQLSQFSLIIFF